MNIKVQCCGIIILIVLMIFYVRKKRLNLPTERAYRRLFLASLVCLCFDILSLVGIHFRMVLPLLLVKMICKTYLIIMVFVVFISFLYICSDVFGKRSVFFKRVVGYGIIAFLAAVLIYVSPISIYEEGSVVYTYGLSVLLTYVACLMGLIGNVIVMLLHSKRIHPRRKRAMFIWLCIWVGAAVIQFIDNGLLLIGYAGAIGVMVIYLQLENPELKLDSYTNLFNYQALRQYMQYLYTEHSSFSVLSVIIHHQFGIKDADMEEVSVIRLLSDIVLSIEQSKAFLIAEDEVLLIFPDETAMEQGVRAIMDGLQERIPPAQKTTIYSDMIQLANAQIVKDEKKLLHLFRYARTRYIELERENVVYLTEEFLESMQREEEMEQVIKEAIEQDGIEVYYQPIYSTRKHCFTSAEALMRIRDKEGNIVPPFAFISVAEANGMILKLGEIVFEKVCRFLRDEEPYKYGIEYIEINLSVVQCADDSLAFTFIDIMEEYGIKPGWINLEITESASLRAKDILLQNMNTLIDYGVRFSLDDFGTGQSNLNYIVDMPVCLVKFDKDMIGAYFENRKAKFVMDAAMQMIHGMNLDIVSEGIETKEQYEVMEELGIRYIQGYYFSKPLPKSHFLEFIKEQN